MNKYEEIRLIEGLFEVESGLDTRLFELAGYPLIEDLVEKMFQLKEQMNKRLNDRAKLLGIGGEFGVVPPDTSHLNNDDFGAFIRGEMTKEEVEAKTLDISRQAGYCISMKVRKVWNIEPQVMLDYILEADRANGRASEEYQPTFYINKPLDYIREVYEDYNGLETLTEVEQIENGYYRLEIS